MNIPLVCRKVGRVLLVIAFALLVIVTIRTDGIGCEERFWMLSKHWWMINDPMPGCSEQIQSTTAAGYFIGLTGLGFLVIGLFVRPRE